MEEGELVLGKINLNVQLKKNQPTPMIEILDHDSAFDGEIVVLKVLRSSSK